MSGAAFLRIKKLKGSGIITVAARHNKREIQAETGAAGSIDPTRSRLNQTLVGPSAAADVGQLAKDLMTAAGVTKLRKDAVMGLEVVFSLPPGHAIDDRAYFSDCAVWAGRYLGGITLSVDIHRDEAAPHCHVLLLPLVDGRMDGGRMVGHKQKLMAMQKQFHLDVAGRYGLNKAPAKLSGASKQVAAQAVLQRLRETGDSALQSVAWATMRDVIERDPGPFLLALGIEQQAPKKKLRTMAAIFTGKGKGPAKEAMSIDFAPAQKERSLCSVDFAAKAPPPPPTTAPPAARKPAPAPTLPTVPLIDPDGVIPTLDGMVGASDEAPIVESRVIRDGDYSSDHYDTDLGDFRPAPPPPARAQKKAAQTWVNAALTNRSTHRDKSGYRH